MSLIGISKKNKKNKIDWSQYPEILGSDIFVTDNAQNRINFLAEQEKYELPLMRVGIKGGGCSGLSYFFELVAEPKDSDKIFSNICVDPKSLKVLGGSILEYESGLLKSGFQILNPKAKKSCSCGQSFSL